MNVWIRRAAVGVALALAAGTLSGTAQPASAAASWPATVLAAPVESLSHPGGLAAAGGRLFATDILAGKVRAYDEKGALLATISSISQAGPIVASADGTRLYVAGESTIREIDTTTLKATATWTVSSCVDDLAVTPTAVYYTYGCYGDSTGGLNHIDLAAGAVHDLAAPDVAGVSTRLATGTFDTVMVATPVFPSHVAVMVTVPAATAVTTPLALMVATAASPVAQVTVRPGSAAPCAFTGVAASCTVPPTMTELLAGETTTALTGTATTVTVAVSLTPSAVAITLADPAPTPVTSPVLETSATPWAVDVHTTIRSVSSAPLGSRTTLVSCVVCPVVTEAAAGEMTTLPTGAAVTGRGR